MFGTSARRRRGPGQLPEPVSAHDPCYDAATLAFMCVVDRIRELPENAQVGSWEEVIEVLSVLPARRGG